ncbi:MAG: efflux RND transporter permease subunit, partial [Gemmatimonadetes bacterium]
LSAAILLGTVVLFVVVPKGFLPSEDSSQIFGTTETVQGTSFDDLVQHQLQVMAILQQDPSVDGAMSFLGGGQINQGRLFLQLKPRSQRSKSVDELIRYYNARLASIPGIQVFLQNPPPIRIGGRLSKSQYQFTLQSPDIQALYQNAQQLQAKMAA